MKKVRSITEQTYCDVRALVKASEILRDSERTARAMEYIENNRNASKEVTVTITLKGEQDGSHH